MRQRQREGIGFIATGSSAWGFWTNAASGAALSRDGN